jgi:antitoxin (DNA-binding transcriptional repressor) of toxin-antitoxin stability system
MEFITVRDLRTRPSEVWDKLRQQRDPILTSSGRPIAVLSHIREAAHGTPLDPAGTRILCQAERL